MILAKQDPSYANAKNRLFMWILLYLFEKPCCFSRRETDIICHLLLKLQESINASLLLTVSIYYYYYHNKNSFFLCNNCNVMFLFLSINIPPETCNVGNISKRLCSCFYYEDLLILIAFRSQFNLIL